MNSKNPIYWTMGNGQKIDVDTMTLSHLQNTLKMIIRNKQSQKKSNTISAKDAISKMTNTNL
jgi:hypothetical protein